MINFIFRENNIRLFVLRRVLRYQRVIKNLYIEDEKTTQWSNEKVQKDKQRSTKHTHKTKDRITRIKLKTARVSSSCFIIGTRLVKLQLSHSL